MCKQYQVRLDPNKLLAYNIPLSTVIDRVKASTNEVGGRVLELSGAQYMIRGLGYLKSLDDLESVAVGSKNGTPVLLRDLGSVCLRPGHPRRRRRVERRRGDGRRHRRHAPGHECAECHRRGQAEAAEIAPSLPAGVEIVAGYDRSGLINDSIETLQRDLLEEAIIVSLVIIVFLFHFRSALIAILALPIAVLVSFIPMYFLGVTSNIMSLGGIALAIGVLGRCRDRDGRERLPPSFGAAGVRIAAAGLGAGAPGDSHQRGEAGRDRRCSSRCLIIVVSFLPVFLLEAQEGRMFRPLAWTKTLAVGFSSILPSHWFRC